MLRQNLKTESGSIINARRMEASPSPSKGGEFGRRGSYTSPSPSKRGEVGSRGNIESMNSPFGASSSPSFGGVRGGAFGGTKGGLLLLLFLFIMFSTSAQFSGGSGSESDPYIIATPAHLAQLATYVNENNAIYNVAGVHYKLGTDIDLSGYGATFNDGAGWIPIGTNSPATARFNAIFDGDGKIISGLYIRNTSASIAYVGLFGYAAVGSVIKNIGLTAVDIVSTAGIGNTFMGGIVGMVTGAGSTISNCWVTGSLSGQANTNSYIGGITGDMTVTATVSNCFTTCSVKSTANTVYSGGIAGRSNGGTISNCWSISGVNSLGRNACYAGGIAGLLTGAAGNISNCAALNLYIGVLDTAEEKYFGRIAVYLNGSLTNSVALNNMINLPDGKDWKIKADNGADITTATILADGTLGNRFTSPVWTSENGKLPGLGTSVTMPDYLSGTQKIVGLSIYKNFIIQKGVTKTIPSKILGYNITDTNLSWNVSGGVSGTTITNNGQITIDANEVAEFVTVTATLTANNTILDSKSVYIDNYFNSGSGAENDPLIINTSAQFAQFATYVNAMNAIYNTPDTYYKLSSDIDLSDYGVDYNNGIGWEPVGHNASPTYPYFVANFDGDGHVITGLYIRNTSRTYVGLFGVNSGSIKNLGVVDADIIISITGSRQIGGIAGYMTCNYDIDGSEIETDITNCWVTGSLKGDVSSTLYLGGIVGNMTYFSTVSNCYSTCLLTADATTSYIGGIAGDMGSENVTLSDCYSTSTITSAATTIHAGGIAGRNSANTIKNCWTTSEINAIAVTTANTGGIAGTVTGAAATISNCVAINYFINVTAGTTINLGRIAGNFAGGALTNNCALNNMVNLPDGLAWSNIGTNMKDGADITNAEILANGSLGSRFTSPIWTTENGKLPGFGAAVAMPDYLTGTVKIFAISVTPKDLLIKKGETKTLIANILGYNATGGGAISWSVEGGLSGTTISNNGVLTIAQDETASEITVTATAVTGDDTLSDSVVVTIDSDAVFDGNGTEDDPYIISTPAQLAQLAIYVNNGTIFNNKYYKLGANIDLSGYHEGNGWTPIGQIDSYPFMGVFDGNNKTVSGMKINASATYAGLFGLITSGAIIKNLGVIDIDIKISSPTSVISTGGIVGRNTGSTINNCYTKGNISAEVSNGNSHRVGGIVGSNAGTISNCWSSTSVKGFCFLDDDPTNVDVAGIAGNNTSGSITNCYFTGTATGYITCFTLRVGGIAGFITTGTISNCWTSGTIEGIMPDESANSSSGFTATMYVGGIAGNINTNALATNCYSTAIVKAYAGVKRANVGVAGIIPTSTGNISNCVALNPLLLCSGGNSRSIARIGTFSTTYLSNNYGYTGMYKNFGSTDWEYAAANDRDGSNLTLAEILVDGTLGGLFTSAGGWTTENGKLPGFGKTENLYMTDAPYIADIFINDIGVKTGTTQTIEALVAGWNVNGTLTWTVEGGSAGTSISNTGALTVSASETARKLKVVATSTEIPSISGSGTVFLTGGGDGTISNPYILTTPGVLMTISELVRSNSVISSKHYKLGNDIDMSEFDDSYIHADGEGWAPIGNSSYSFSGTFDGDGFIISNIYSNQYHLYAHSETGGFFGSAAGATVKNLGLVNLDLTWTAPGEGFGYVGGIVGQNVLLIDNCYVTGSITATNSGPAYIAGIAGFLGAGTVSNSWSELVLKVDASTTTSYSIASGIAGTCGAGSITKSYSKGSISINARDVAYSGGIAGYISGAGLINNCWSSASISSVSPSDARAGGITGRNNAAATIMNSAALNSGITNEALTKYYGRIVGNDVTSTLINNIGYDEMIHPNGTAWQNIGANNFDGDDIDKETINSDATLGGMFTVANGWILQKGKLPGIGAPVNMPLHLLIPEGTYTVSGKVTGVNASDVLAGVEITLLGYDDYSVITDELGNFEIKDVYGGEGFYYTIKASMYGYYIHESEILVKGNYEHNITLSEIPVYTISGNVTGNDSNSGIEDVVIKITGYGTFSIITDEVGDYEIEVFDGFTYLLTAAKSGYSLHSASVKVDGANLTHDITLVEYLFPVQNVIATVADEKEVEITWTAPVLGVETNYILDDGSAELGFYQASGYSLTAGNQFDNDDDGFLTSVDVFSTYGNTGQRSASINIYNSNRELIGSSESLVLESDKWTNVPLNNIPYSGTFYAMVNWSATPGLMHLGYDTNGPNSRKKLSWLIDEDDDEWYLIIDAVAGAIPGVFSIRANANIIGEGKNLIRNYELGITNEEKVLNNKESFEFQVSSFENQMPKAKTLNYKRETLNNSVSETLNNFSYSVTQMLDAETLVTYTYTTPEGEEMVVSDKLEIDFNKHIKKSTSALCYFVTVNGSTLLPESQKSIRTLQSYNVYRLSQGQAETNWTKIGENVTNTEYIDTEWLDLEANAYQYAVKAVYTTGESKSVLSNVLGKDIYVDYQINITTNTGNSPTGAKVKLTNQNGNPFQIYQATSDANGVYFNEVWKGIYDLEIILDGFTKYIVTGLEILVDGQFHDAELKEILSPTGAVTATETGGNAVVTWNAPNSPVTFRYDSGTASNRIGFNNASAPRSAFGSCHRVGASLTSISWNTSVATVNVWVLALNADGKPSNTVLYSANNVTGTSQQWSTHQFPVPVEAPNGFFIAVGQATTENIGIGVSNHTNQYPFMAQANFYFSDIQTGNYTPLDGTQYEGNFMVRAEGISMGKSVMFGNDVENTLRGFVGYNVYRLQDGQENEDDWTQLATNTSALTYTDTNWSSISWGAYRFAVKAVYSTGLSKSVQSNTLYQGMNVDCQINIHTNSGLPATGATVTLTNQDESNRVHISISDANGVHITNVWRGVYSLKVALAGYELYTVKDLDITDNTNTFEVNLIDQVYPVGSVIATEVGNNALIKWTAGVPPLNEDITWCVSDEVTGQVGYSETTGADMSIAQRFTPTDLAANRIVSGHKITKILIGVGTNMNNVNTMEIRIWEGGNSITNAGTLVYTQQITNFTTFEENTITEIVLTTPYVIDASKELRIGWRIVNTAGYPIGRDAGPVVAGKGDLIICPNPVLWGGAWVSAYTQLGWNFNFSIKALVTDGNRELNTNYEQEISRCLQITSDFEKNTEIFENSQFSILNSQLFGYSVSSLLDNSINQLINNSIINPRSAAGFTVYRLLPGQPETEWLKIEDNVVEMEFIDKGWKEIEIGSKYQYAIRAKYGSGIATAVLSNQLEKTDVGINGIEIAEFVIYPNPFTDEINISNKGLVKNVQITNASGKNIKKVIFDGKPIPTKDLASGVYFIVIESITGDKTVYKMVKK